MLGSIFSSLGASLGSYFGGGILSTIGKYAGNRLGSYLQKKWFQKKEYYTKFTNIKDSFTIAKAQYGQPIPLTFGNMRVPGQIIWADEIGEKRNSNLASKYFKNRNITVTRETIELEYNASFAMAICAGIITDINRVWFLDELIDLSQYKFRLYKGDEEQMPDPLIMQKQGDEHCPAYRGLAYIVFENLPLADFDNVIPNFEFEVTRKPNIKKRECVEDLVKSMVMIPGSGEYVYDTIMQNKKLKIDIHNSAQESINSHNHQNIPDSLRSLDQMQAVCENVEWVAPVVCWFGDNVNAGSCLIKPAIEFNDPDITYSEEWRVGKYNRSSAYIITKDNENNPLYGGSINDESVVRYLTELKQRTLKTMFYPMFFLDVELKPWRGRVTGSGEEISRFFNQEHGYNDFILHYANLVKNHVDAFVIGSELIGLTRVRSGERYPAVDELCKLAARVKQIVGPKVQVTYAADWSEYHHTEGGWYNLDPLWASDSIDFIGIDAYFPVTNSISSFIKQEDIDTGWQSGEGYDYCVRDEQKITLEAKYAWKNLHHWWANKHVNPDSKTTAWQPKSKQIWFTEYGFPSIDKAPNQPNVFFDPNCLDGGTPRYSTGEIDFNIQRKAIRAFIEYWEKQECVDRMFLWTWDARPYPAWPHMDIWRDGYLWEKGHWVNDKFGISNLASIILEISNHVGLDAHQINVKTLDIPVEGLYFSNQISAINAINTLRTAYFFDINSFNSAQICFTRRSEANAVNIHAEQFVALSKDSFFAQSLVPESEMLGYVNLYNIESLKNYRSLHKFFRSESPLCSKSANVNLPIVMSQFESEKIGKLILDNARAESQLLNFNLLCTAQTLRPGDFVEVHHQQKTYPVRVVNVTYQDLTMRIIAISDQRVLYHYNNFARKRDVFKTASQVQPQLITYAKTSDQGGDNFELCVHYNANIKAPLYVKLFGEQDWQHLQNINPTNSICRISDFEHDSKQNIFLIDEISYLVIHTENITLSKTLKWRRALWGDEFIYFKKAEELDKFKYKITFLSRGVGNSLVKEHVGGETLTLIEQKCENLLVSSKLSDQSLIFKCGSQTSSLTLPNKNGAKIYLSLKEISEGNLHLKWVMRGNSEDLWQLAGEEIKVEYKITVNPIFKDSKFSEIIVYTKNNEINVNISQFPLSADFNIDIIPVIIN